MNGLRKPRCSLLAIGRDDSGLVLGAEMLGVVDRRVDNGAVGMLLLLKAKHHFRGPLKRREGDEDNSVRLVGLGLPRSRDPLGLASLAGSAFDGGG